MQHEFQQYRFARIEGHNITRARLEAQFKGGIADRDEIEKVVAQQLATEPERRSPWRKSEIEQTGYRDGIRIAALEFYWAYRHATAKYKAQQSHSGRNCGGRARSLDQSPAQLNNVPESSRTTGRHRAFWIEPPSLGIRAEVRG